MRIVYVCGRLPYPPVSGGQLDTFNRARELRRLGHEIVVVAALNSNEQPPSAADISWVEREVGEVVLMRASRRLLTKLLKLLNLWRVPLLAVSIDGDSAHRSFARLRAFAPDMVWMDYIFMLPYVKTLARALDTPVAMRSQNIEHRYRRALVKASRGLGSKAMAWLRSLCVSRLETEAANFSCAIFDISASDTGFWNQIAPGRMVRWLPPVFTFATETKTPVPTHHAAFLGSLSTSTNIEGLMWYFEKVHPLIVVQSPKFSVLIGGSRPAASFVRYLQAIPHVELRSNVLDPNEIWAAGRVLINPVLSGEGINMKAVEMLGFDKPLVTTSVGVRGFPEEVRNSFLIGNDPEAFANQLLQALSSPAPDHALARGWFDASGFAKVIEELEHYPPIARKCAANVDQGLNRDPKRREG